MTSPTENAVVKLVPLPVTTLLEPEYVIVPAPAVKVRLVQGLPIGFRPLWSDPLSLRTLLANVVISPAVSWLLIIEYVVQRYSYIATFVKYCEFCRPQYVWVSSQ